MIVRVWASVLVLAAGIVEASKAPALAQGGDCTREATSIRRGEKQLPRLEVAPPNDQQIVCITLETNLLFARRFAAHLKHCPRSPLARDGARWERIDSDYESQFRDRRCKPAIRSYRG